MTRRHYGWACIVLSVLAFGAPSCAFAATSAAKAEGLLPPRAGAPAPTPDYWTSESKAEGQLPSLSPSPPPSTPAQLAQAGFEVVTRPDEELLLLEVRLNDLVLTDAMPAFFNGSSLILPLRELALSLDFPIEVTETDGTAEGWFLAENRLFLLNVGRGEVVVEGQPGAFDSGMIEVQPDDIYVDIRLLSKWFPIDIDMDVSNLLVTVASREALPIERKLAREGSREKVMAQDTTDLSSLPQVASPPRPVGWPMLNIDSQTGAVRQSGGHISLQTQYNATAAMDLGYMNAEMFLSGISGKALSDTRVTLSRKAPDGLLFGERLGEMPLTELSLGDIYTPDMPLVGTTHIGKGMTVSNFPLNSNTEFDRVTLTGDLPLGWEVELYRNEVLLDYAVDATDSRYEFADVPLLFGRNVIKLVFYGPQGQQREEIKTYNVGRDLVTPGDFRFRASVNKQDKRFLYSGRDAPQELEGKTRVFVEGRTGLSRNFSLGTNFAEVPLTSGAQRYAGVNGSVLFGNVLGRADVYTQLGNGWAGRLSGQTNVSAINLFAQHDVYRNYVSEYMDNTTDPVISNSKLRADGAIPETFLPRIPFSLTTDIERNESGARTVTVGNRLSAAVGRASLTHTLSGSATRSAAMTTTRTADGTLLLGGRVSDVRVRGQATYDILPKKHLTGVSLNTDWTLSPEVQLHGSVYRPINQGITAADYSLGASAAFDTFSAGLTTDFTQNREWAVTLSLNFSLARDPNSGRIGMMRDNVTGGGALSAFVFLDNNANGTFDDGDEPLPDIGFTVDGLPSKARTGEDGYVFLPGLTAHKQVKVAVDTKTITDPYWIARPDAIAVTPQPGSIVDYVFPVITTGEIDGTVFRAWDDATEGAAGVVVELINANGEVVRHLTTAYDGFYLFDFVGPGAYTVRVSPDQLTKLGLTVDGTPYPVTIEGDGTLASGKDFLIK